MRAVLAVMDGGWFVKSRVSTHLAKAMRGEITSPLDDLCVGLSETRRLGDLELLS